MGKGKRENLGLAHDFDIAIEEAIENDSNTVEIDTILPNTQKCRDAINDYLGLNGFTNISIQKRKDEAGSSYLGKGCYNLSVRFTF